jgi:putative endonuclease
MKHVMDRAEIGEIGERIAGDYLVSKGFDILARNWVQYTKTGKKFGEVDIIAEKDDIVRFVEVKTIKPPKDLPIDVDMGITPEQRVNYKKQRKLRALAQIWLNKSKEFANSEFQIDIISVIINLESRKAKVFYFQNAVEGD